MAQHTYHGNRQDARESGESPLLPRNCERHRFDSRRLGASKADFSQIHYAKRE